MKRGSAEYKNWLQYSKTKNGGYQNRCKINHVELHAQNSFEHELMKFILCYELRNAGLSYITEAYNKKGERHDVVCISNNHVYEVETDPKRAKRFEGRKEVKVVPLWALDSGDVGDWVLFAKSVVSEW